MTCATQAKPAMWTAILQPEENESDLERFADAPDQTGLTADGTAPVAEDADGHEPPGTAPGATAQSGQRQNEAAASKPAEEPWPAEGAYDMSKRCVSAVLKPTCPCRTQLYLRVAAASALSMCWHLHLCVWVEVTCAHHVHAALLDMISVWLASDTLTGAAVMQPTRIVARRHMKVGACHRDSVAFWLVASALGRGLGDHATHDGRAGTPPSAAPSGRPGGSWPRWRRTRTRRWRP